MRGVVLGSRSGSGGHVSCSNDKKRKRKVVSSFHSVHVAVMARDAETQSCRRLARPKSSGL